MLSIYFNNKKLLCPEDGKSSAVINLCFVQRSCSLPGDGGQILLSLEMPGVADAKFGMWGTELGRWGDGEELLWRCREYGSSWASPMARRVSVQRIRRNTAI